MTRFLLVIATIVLLPVAGSEILPAHASHSWSSFHWSRAANPVLVEVVDSVSAGWDAHLATGAADWDSALSTVIDTTVVADTTGTKIKPCKPIAGKVRVCSAAYGRRRWVGLAQVWISSGGHIAKARVKLNDSYFLPIGSMGANAMHTVACHELGHALGLGHQNGVDSSCLREFVSGADPAKHPNAHDYDELATKYNSHFDTAASPVTSSGDHAGHPVRVHRDGRYTVVTFEFPAP